jgi:predicted amidophosphoribosyltransferase
VLIDDVSTSGATLDACAAELKETGAESVWGLTLAREI